MCLDTSHLVSHVTIRTRHPSNLERRLHHLISCANMFCVHFRSKSMIMDRHKTFCRLTFYHSMYFPGRYYLPVCPRLVVLQSFNGYQE